MGTYRTLHAGLACVRCGVVRRAEVQFKTGDDRAMPDYEIGDRADDVAPDLYEGVADAYCSSCMRDWIDDEKRAWCQVLAEDVAAGRVVARTAICRHGSLDGRPELGMVVTIDDRPALTAAEVLALADVREGFGWPSFTARLYGENIALWAADLRVHPHDPQRDSSQWWIDHSDEVARRLRGIGWANGESRWIEVPVVVDADRRLRLAT